MKIYGMQKPKVVYIVEKNLAKGGREGIGRNLWQSQPVVLRGQLRSLVRAEE